MTKEKPEYKRSFFDKTINIICYIIAVVFVINEYSHLYRSLDTIKAAPDLYERHYSFSATFPFAGSYFLMPPKNYNPKYKYPLIVDLHGVSTRSYAAEALASDAFRNTYPFFVMIPIAPTRAFWATPKDKAYRMVRNIPYPDHLPQVVAGINDIKSNFNIDDNKIIITGHSMGGTGVIGALERYPDLFKIGIASAGAWPPHELTNMRAPLFVFHGANDVQVPVQYSRDLSGLAKVQNKMINVSILRGQGHGIGPMVYSKKTLWSNALKMVN